MGVKPTNGKAAGKRVANIDLTPAQLRTVRSLLAAHLPGTEVWAYGSRVTFATRHASDLDLVAFASQEQRRALSRLVEALNDSDLPFTVDVLVWDNIPARFHPNIKRAYFVIQEKQDGGALLAGWKVVTLGDVLLLANGRVSPDRDAAGNYTVYGSSGIIGRSHEFNSEANTIIIGRVGHAGSLYFSPQKCWVTDNAIRASSKSGNSPLFLHYLLKTLRLGSMSIGSSQPLITQAVLTSIQATIPPLPEQQAIAHILGVLDDKIEANRGRSEALEESAKALFKSWFVDFDPVRAKMALKKRATGGWTAARARAYLATFPAEVRDLFPDTLVDSEMEKIPKGWKVIQMSDMADITMGQSPPGSTYSDEEVGLPFYQGSADFGSRFPSIRKFCSAPTRLAQRDDVLLSVRAPVGDINRAKDECCIGRGLASIRAKGALPSWMFYRCTFLKDHFDAFNSEGTVFGSLSGADLRATKLVAPGDALLRQFENVAAPLDQLIRNKAEEIDALSALRDTILPKLVSGELRIPDAEKILRKAGI